MRADIPVLSTALNAATSFLA